MFEREWKFLAVLAALVAAGAAAEHPDALNDQLRRYVNERLHEFEKIPQERRDELNKLAGYVRDRAKAHQPVRLMFICTHNSRRSQMCEIWAAAAAAWYGRTDVEVYSGGTEVTSFNPRAVAALRRAGFAIDEPKTTQNPRFRVRWSPTGPQLECFSKFYHDAANPQADFCAVMTCSQADKHCPIVHGAAKRLSLPFDDPKVFDNTPEESSKYDERCAQIARELLYVFSRVDR
jgi:arsenate reductase (thioredoxin)